MKYNNINKSVVAVSIILMILVFPILSTMGDKLLGDTLRDESLQTRSLPPPLDLTVVLEQAIARRMSVREFTDEQVSEEELSTILWAACGFTSSGNKTIYEFGGTNAVVIYVLLEDAVYTYHPANHSLVLYRNGDFRSEVGWQYTAPIQLGLARNTDYVDEFSACFQIGETYQNIAFAVNVLGLGTVVTGEVPSPLELIGLPDNQEAKIVMPIGHPLHEYNFKNRPQWISFLPRVQEFTMTLSTALDKNTPGEVFNGELSMEAINQLLWSSYGFSYYLDKSQQDLNIVKRHRTVPSAHGYYPFETYVVMPDGLFHYYHNILIGINRIPIDFIGLPVVPIMIKLTDEDLRNEIADVSHSSIETAPLSLIIILNLEKTRPSGTDDFSGDWIRWLWHLEAGSMAHNVILQATSLNHTAGIFPILNDDSIRSLIGLDSNYDPMYIVPVGE